AADDKLAIRRAAAAHVLGHCTKEQRKLATKMLGDTDAQVRFHAAASLLRSREPDSVPALAAVLTDGPLALAWQAEDMLFRVAGEKGPAVTLGSGGEDERRKSRAAWDGWWKDNKATIDFKKISLEDALLGLNLIVELDGSAGDGSGLVWE